MSITTKVRIPGTTANCGAGFDAVGMACTIYNDLELTLMKDGKLDIEVFGEGKGAIPVDERNIVWKAIQAVLHKVGLSYSGIHIKMNNHIPLARGLGSSAAAIVAGLVAANKATGDQLTKHELLTMATALEGHPDNVAPAIFGGIVVSIMRGKDVQSLRFMPPVPLTMVVAVPDFTLSTKTSREVLPLKVPLKDAVFNVSRTALLVSALCQGEFGFLKYALDDKLHQPYRQKLIPGMQAVFQAAQLQGALGSVISGAGPSIIAFTQQNAEAVGNAMVNAFKAYKITSHYLILDIDSDGAKNINA